MLGCEKCGKPLSQEYSREWRICRKCRGVEDTDNGESSNIPDIATGKEVKMQRKRLIAERGESMELLDDEMNDVIQLAQLTELKKIRKYLSFFVTLTVIGISAMGIALIRLIIMFT